MAQDNFPYDYDEKSESLQMDSLSGTEKPGETPRFVIENPLPLDPDPELQSLVDRIGDFIKHWGFRKVDGMIWAYLFLAPRPLASKEITDLMNISKGLTSISIQNLIRYGAIKKVHRGKRRTLYFTSTNALGDVVEDILRYREREMIADIHEKSEEARKKISNEHPWANPKRFQQLQFMIKNGRDLLDSRIFTEKVLEKINFDSEETASEGLFH